MNSLGVSGLLIRRDTKELMLAGLELKEGLAKRSWTQVEDPAGDLHVQPDARGVSRRHEGACHSERECSESHGL